MTYPFTSDVRDVVRVCYECIVFTRCAWAEGSDELSMRHHDEEWGVPSHDDRHLFELLILEGAQAGLSWSTILRKREGYRSAFEGFDPARVAAFDQDHVESLLQDPGIVRNRSKVEATVQNARSALGVVDDFGSLDAFLWGLVAGAPIQNRWKVLAELPAETPASQAMSKTLKARGFRFVGPTICYAFMQAVGIVNDHTVDCFRYEAVAGMA